MSAWYRVFGTNQSPVEPAALLEHLNGQGLPVKGHFRGDDQGWFRAELLAGNESTPIFLDRFLVTEEGIRAELNTWAGWLETAEDNPNHGRLMEHMIQTTQLFTVQPPDAPAEAGLMAQVCLQTCRHLARETDGVFQVDNQGFFAADGTLLLGESA